ncbi:MAG: N-acetylglucosamine-6-phosphate deacetylase [Bacillota bacterium]|nr:N-acetylglucosamine-6-phosphate deacetylase [Bacillota bacterium]
MKLTIKNGNVVFPTGVHKTNIEIENGKIIGFTDSNIDSQSEIFDASSHYVMPGFIDLQTNGVAGFDVMDGTEEAISKMVEVLPSQGVTGFLPTTVTGEGSVIANSLRAIAKVKNKNLPGSEILGVHVEGPYISYAKSGAHEQNWIRAFNKNEFDRWNELSGNLIKLLTLAPEVNNNLDFIQELKKQNIIVSIGHSNAPYHETIKAFDFGINYSTHLFNGMSGMHHREPGVAGAVLSDERVFASFIPDLQHVHPALLKMIYKIKGREKSVIVSDQVFLTGLPPGEYKWGDQLVISNGTFPTVKSTGSLAGSLLQMNISIKNMVEAANIPLHDAVFMAATTPAMVLGIAKEAGSIEKNKRANLTILNKDYEVTGTIKDGIWIFKK